MVHLLKVIGFGAVLGALHVVSVSVPFEVLLATVLVIVGAALIRDGFLIRAERRAAAEAEREAELDYLVAVSRGRV